MCSIFAQWVNSYKRLVPGYEAPVYAAWSRRNRSALVRVPLYHPGKEQRDADGAALPRPSVQPLPDVRGAAASWPGGDRARLRAARSDGEEPLPPVSRTSAGGSASSSCRRRSGEAIELTAESELVLRALGEHMFNRYIEIKRQEWDDYRVQVTPWELQRYLPVL